MNDSKAGSFAISLATTILVVAALYFAKDVLIPFSMALLLSFVLAPLVQKLQRRKIGRAPAVVIVTLLSFTIIGGLTYTIGHEIFNFAEDLPQYKDNLTEKIRSLRHPMGTTLGKTKETVKELGKEIEKGQEKTPGTTKVEIVEPPLTSAQIIQGALLPLVKPLGTAGIVIVFVIFMLARREDLRDRLIRLIGPGNLHVTTQALDDAANRISRYLTMQLLINSMMGICVAIGLFLIQVPNAILWGALVIILRFIPYLGPWIAAALPTILCLAVFDTWTPVILTISLFAVLELITNNFIEPWLYGSHTGLSSIALIAAAVVWTWLWGSAGLLLSTPLTVCLVVMGKYIPQLSFLDILLGDEPVLRPEDRLYQRLVAGNLEEAEELIEDEIKNTTTPALQDNVLIPVLSRAIIDHHRGGLDEQRLRQVLDHIREIAADLTVHAEPLEEISIHVPVLCLPAHSEADEIAAQLLAESLDTPDLRVGASRVHLVSEMIEQARQRSCRLICISALPTSAILHSRYICKRLRRELPDVSLIVVLHNQPELKEVAISKLKPADRVAFSIEEARQYATELSQLSPQRL